jgi:hypothetical protein
MIINPAFAKPQRALGKQISTENLKVETWADCIQSSAGKELLE